jgi:hypothetical protein
MPDTAQNLVIKAYAAVGTAIAGRGKEICALLFGDVVRVVDEDGIPAYHITYDRSKMRTSNSTERDIAILKCCLGVQATDRYLALFPAKTRKDNLTSRLWRRCTQSPRGGISSSWKAQSIGVNTCKNFGYVIAAALGLDNPKSFTGHCWRRSAATLAANAGLSLPQIKALTGHKSDTVVQRYIERSMPMIEACAAGTAVGDVPVSRKRPRTDDTQLGRDPSRVGFSSSSGTSSSSTQHPAGAWRRTTPASAGLAPTYNIQLTVTGDVSGSLGLFQRD